MPKLRLYFIGAKGRIKIGVSQYVNRRMGEIGKHLNEPLELLGDVEGSHGLEKHLHGMLAAHGLGREWFSDCAEVRDVMRGVLAGDLFGYVEKPAPVSKYQPRDQTPEEWLAMFNRLVAMVFPGDPVGGFAEFFELPREEVAAFLKGEKPVPRMIAMAFASRLTAWIFEHPKN